MENKSIDRRKGFTLLELAIVGIFLGLLAIFAVMTMNSSAVLATQARVMNATTQSIADGWRTLVLSCGVGNDIAGTDVSTFVGATSAEKASYNLGVLAGKVPIKPELATCYKLAGLKPLNLLRAEGKGVGAAPMLTLAEKTWSTSHVEVSVENGNRMRVKYVNISADLARRTHAMFSPDVDAQANVGSASFVSYVDARTGYEYGISGSKGFIVMTYGI